MVKAIATAVLLGAGMMAAAQGVKVTPHVADRRVDVTIDGQPFTSYVWPTSLMKPVLYPLIEDGGVEVTRGFPLAPRPGERQDHPHHAGLWFNYGNVNGFDFWNNSTAIPDAQKPKMGTVTFQKIVSATSGKESGTLVTDSIWITGENKPLLQQRTTYTFWRSGKMRGVDQQITLTALDKAVFNDDKEGLLGMRVARWLESPNERGGIFTDANGKQTKVEGASGAGATGVYETSEGITGDKVWSTRGRWCMLKGTSPDGKTATVAILDYPQNPDYPTYWHARGYGLFAANPLGAHIFDPKAQPFAYTLEKGKSVTFRYRVLMTPEILNAATMNKLQAEFAAK